MYNTLSRQLCDLPRCILHKINVEMFFMVRDLSLLSVPILVVHVT